MKRWLKKENRPMSNIFICPECRKECYCLTLRIGEDKRRENICDYPYCPRCGMKVLQSNCTIER